MANKISDLYLSKNYNCAEATLRQANKDFNLDLKEEDLVLSAGFGGGMGCGLTCGLLSADIMVLSKVFVKGKAHEVADFRNLCKTFVSAFRKKFGGTTCLYIKKKEAKPDIRCLNPVDSNYELLKQFIKENK